MANRATTPDGTVTFEKVATASDEIGLLESTPAFFSPPLHIHTGPMQTMSLLSCKKEKEIGKQGQG